jgi:hypothetical protein
MTMYGLLASPTVAVLSLPASVSNALRAVLAFLPKLIGFVVVLVVGWIVARVLRTLITKGLHRVHFDQAIQRGGRGEAVAPPRVNASRLIGEVVFYAVLLIALQIAFGLFGPNPVSTWLTAIVAWLPRLLAALIIVVVATLIARAVREIVSSALGTLAYGRLLGNVAAIFIIALGVIAALNQIGVATTVTTPVLIAVLATIAGVIVVGVGGGMVKPMQQRWERWLGRVEEEAPQATAQAEAYRRGREDAARTQRAAQPGAAPGAPGEPMRTPPDTPAGQVGGRPAGGTTTPPPGGQPPQGPRRERRW